MKLISLKTDDRRIGLKFSYHKDLPGIIKQAKAQAGIASFYHPDSKSYVVEADKAVQLAHFILTAFKATDAVLARTEKIITHVMTQSRSITPDVYVDAIDITFLRTTQNESVVRVSRYDPVIINTLKQLTYRYNPSCQAWIIQEDHAQIAQMLEAHAGFPHHRIQVDQRIIDIRDLDGALKSSAGFIELGVSLIPQGIDGVEESDDFSVLASADSFQVLDIDTSTLREKAQGFGLYPEQVDGVEFISKRSAALLGDDMGVGKTPQAIVAAELMGVRTLITCPAYLRLNWQREIEKFVGHRAPLVQVISRLSDHIDPQAQWVILSYELAGQVSEAQAKAFGLLIIDEAHHIKNPRAQRTINLFLLGAVIPRKFLLTGTPILNCEEELYTLLRLSGHPAGQVEMSEFIAAYTGDAHARSALNQMINDWMIRRMKTQVAKELPTKHVHRVEITPPDDIMAEYLAIANDPERYALEKTTRLRMLSETAKLPYLEQEIIKTARYAKCLVFCNYKASVMHLTEYYRDRGLQSVKVLGSNTPAQRMKAVDTFQTQDACRALVGTIDAAGTGLNLTAATVVYFAGLPWTPAELEQAEDRAYRRGQHCDVHCIQPYINHTIDMNIIALLSSKKVISNQVMAAEPEGMQVYG